MGSWQGVSECREICTLLSGKLWFSAYPPRLTGGYYLQRGVNVHDIIIYDALSITSRIHQVSDIVELLGMQDAPWITVNGAKGFAYRQYYECISIHHCRDDGIIWLEMTGQGCRAFESYGSGDYESLFQLVQDNPGDMKITRLDVAFDDHTGILDIKRLCDDTRNSLFVSRFNEWQVIEGSKGCSVTHGSMKSEIFLRIYDKAAERGLDDGSHWVRVELQLRRDRAMQFIKQSGDIGSRFCGVLLNYVRYIEPDGLDSNKWRWSLKPYWQNLVNFSSAISLYVKPGTEYNMARMTNYVFEQAGNAIDATIQILGLDTFLEELYSRDARPNPKYIDVVKKAQSMKEEYINGNG